MACKNCASGNPCGPKPCGPNPRGRSYREFRPSTALARRNFTIPNDFSLATYEALMKWQRGKDLYASTGFTDKATWDAMRSACAEGGVAEGGCTGLLTGGSTSTPSLSRGDVGSDVLALNTFLAYEGRLNFADLKGWTASAAEDAKDLVDKKKKDAAAFYKQPWFIPTMVAGAAVLVIGVVVLRTK